MPCCGSQEGFEGAGCLFCWDALCAWTGAGVKTLRGCSWKRCRLGMDPPRDLACGSTPHLNCPPFPRDDLTRCSAPPQGISPSPGDPEGLSEEPDLSPQSPPLSPVHLVGCSAGDFWGVTAPAATLSMHNHTALCLRSCPFPLAGAAGLKPKCCGFSSGFTSTIGKGKKKM